MALTPGQIFWANVELFKRPGTFSKHPAVFVKTIEADSHLIFCGTHTPMEELTLLKMISFTGMRYGTLRQAHMDKDTYFYEEHMQPIAESGMRSRVVGRLHLSDFNDLLIAAGFPPEPPPPQPRVVLPLFTPPTPQQPTLRTSAIAATEWMNVRVQVNGRPGTVVGIGLDCLKVRFDGGGMMDYSPDEATRI